jgi:hypothetical protein
LRRDFGQGEGLGHERDVVHGRGDRRISKRQDTRNKQAPIKKIQMTKHKRLDR